MEAVLNSAAALSRQTLLTPHGDSLGNDLGKSLRRSEKGYRQREVSGKYSDGCQASSRDGASKRKLVERFREHRREVNVDSELPAAASIPSSLEHENHRIGGPSKSSSKAHFKDSPRRTNSRAGGEHEPPMRDGQPRWQEDDSVPRLLNSWNYLAHMGLEGNGVIIEDSPVKLASVHQGEHVLAQAEEDETSTSAYRLVATTTPSAGAALSRARLIANHLHRQSHIHRTRQESSLLHGDSFQFSLDFDQDTQWHLSDCRAELFQGQATSEASLQSNISTTSTLVREGRAAAGNDAARSDKLTDSQLRRSRQELRNHHYRHRKEQQISDQKHEEEDPLDLSSFTCPYPSCRHILSSGNYAVKAWADESDLSTLQLGSVSTGSTEALMCVHDGCLECFTEGKEWAAHCLSRHHDLLDNKVKVEMEESWRRTGGIVEVTTDETKEVEDQQVEADAVENRFPEFGVDWSGGICSTGI